LLLLSSAGSGNYSRKNRPFDLILAGMRPGESVFMILLRMASRLLLLLAAALALYDGMRSVAMMRLDIMPLGPLWRQLHSASLTALEQATSTAPGSTFLEPALVFLLRGPAWSIPLILAFVLAYIGRKKPRPHLWLES
jgi:hypothetical protein